MSTRSLSYRKISKRILVRLLAKETNHTNFAASAQRDIITLAVDTNALLDKELARYNESMTGKRRIKRYRLASVRVRRRLA